MKHRAVVVALATAVAGSTVLISGLPAASALSSVQASVVSAVPQAGTPQILDGAVFATAQVGDTMVVGGSFTKTQSSDPDSPHSTPYVMAFDAGTGAVRTAFAPRIDGKVQTVLPGPVDGTVYVGGVFRTMDGVPVNGLVLLNVADGSRVTTFTTPKLNLWNVQTVKRVGDRLYVGGGFSTVGSVAHAGLVTLNAMTGTIDPFLHSNVAVNHNWTTSSPKGSAKAPVGVYKLDVSPDGTKMVAIGNFKQVDGATHDQIAMWDLTGPTAVLRDWNTTRLQAACTAKAFDSYVRDVEFSPDGSYFVLGSTGGYGPAGSLCDSAARWESGATGQSVQPTWVNLTGKDTILSVAVTGTAVYVGGHQRWLNNGLGADSAGPGAVPRPGVAALDPVNGLPLAWNPGRSPRGAGAYSLYATATGLWMGSDTNYVGNYKYKRSKIAFFPLAGGQAPAAKSVPALPGQVVAGTATGALTTRTFDGTTAGPATSLSSPLDVASTRGAMVVGDSLFYGKSDANLYRRTLTRGTWGAETLVDPYNDPVWSNVKTGTGTGLYRGAKPTFYSKIPNVTSMFYDGSGRMYYTLSKQSGLYSRAFTPDSGIVSWDETQLPGVSLPDLTGAFLSGSTLYYVTRADGNLNRVGFDGTRLVGAAAVVSGPSKDGVDWRSQVLFLGPQNQPPTADSAITCTNLRCTADGSTSSDPDGTVSSYTWTWGDGATSTGLTSTHDYATAGTYQVMLTVTDDQGALTTTTRFVTVTAHVNALPTASFSSSCDLTVCTFDGTGSADPDGPIASWSWSFGDWTTGAGTGVSHTFPAAGTYPVTLTVTDSSGASASTTSQLTVQAAATSSIAFRGASSLSSNYATLLQVPVPDGVQPGDALLLKVATSGTGSNPTPPADWSEVTRQVAGSALSVMWQHVATAQDTPGSTVPVQLATAIKSTSQILAYSGTATTSPASVAVSAGDTGLASSHPAPAVQVPVDGSWVVSFWTDKSSSTQTWTPPAGLTVRADSYGTGTGYLTTIMGDEGAARPAGTVPARIATTDATSRAAMTSIALAPASAPPAPSESIAFRGASNLSSNYATLLQVPVPDGVQPGDALLLKVATSGTGSNPTPPADWSEVTRQVAGSALSVVWQHVATAQDTPGSTVPVQLAAAIKSTSQILAYSGTATTSPASVAVSAGDSALTTAHTAPAVEVPTAGSWVVWFWTDKSSGTSSWQVPVGLAVRADSYGTGTGYLTTITGDDGVGQPAGTVPARTATTDVASRGAMIAIVLAPAGP